jgi:hypothetical protein
LAARINRRDLSASGGLEPIKKLKINEKLQ